MSVRTREPRRSGISTSTIQVQTGTVESRNEHASVITNTILHILSRRLPTVSLHKNIFASPQHSAILIINERPSAAHQRIVVITVLYNGILAFYEYSGRCPGYHKMYENSWYVAVQFSYSNSAVLVQYLYEVSQAD